MNETSAPAARWSAPARRNTTVFTEDSSPCCGLADGLPAGERRGLCLSYTWLPPTNRSLAVAVKHAWRWL